MANEKEEKVGSNDHELYLISYLLHISTGALCYYESTFLRKTFRAFGVPFSVALFFLIMNKDETLHRRHFLTILKFSRVLPYTLLKSVP